MVALSYWDGETNTRKWQYSRRFGSTKFGGCVHVVSGPPTDEHWALASLNFLAKGALEGRTVVRGAQRNGKLGGVVGDHDLEAGAGQGHAHEHGDRDQGVGDHKQNGSDGTEHGEEVPGVHGAGQRSPQHCGDQETVDGHSDDENLVQFRVHEVNNWGFQIFQVRYTYIMTSKLTKRYGHVQEQSNEPLYGLPAKGADIKHVRHSKGDHSEGKEIYVEQSITTTRENQTQ